VREGVELDGVRSEVPRRHVRGHTEVALMSAPVGRAVVRGLFLEDAGPNKIMVIKVIREHTGLGLADSKNLVDRAPCDLVDWTDPERVGAFREALAGAGARVR
jgi:large subunit ribosomal protein L7/L12